MFKIGLVGPTNAGKSLLFNKLLGSHRAIVTDLPGTTRELLRDEVQIARVHCELIDSPGLLDFSAEMKFIEDIILDADLLLFVVDGKNDIGQKEQEIHQMICRLGKFEKTVLVVNKLDGKVYARDYELLLSSRYVLGYERVVGISAEQQEGLENLYDEMIQVFADLDEYKRNNPTLDRASLKAYHEQLDDEEALDKKKKIHLAIVGRPNAGKSTLLNKLAGDDISFVSDIPGTTLDYLKAEFNRKGFPIQLYDTAGIKKKGHMFGLERIAYEKTKSLLEYVHPLTIMLIDLQEGLTKRDASLLQECIEMGVPLVIAVNKIDLFSPEESKEEIKKFSAAVKIPQWVPLIPISAHHAIGLPKLMQAVMDVHRYRSMRIDTAALNKVVTKAWLTKPPRFPKNKICKWKYITQIKSAPPLFMVSINRKEYVNFSFISRLEKVIREGFGLQGVPMRFERKEKKNENPYSNNYDT